MTPTRPRAATSKRQIGKDTFVVVALTTAVTSLMVWLAPSPDFVRAEVSELVAESRSISSRASQATGAIHPSARSSLQPIWFGTSQPYALGPDDANLDTKSSPPRLSLHAAPSPVGLAEVIARIDPVVTDGRLTGWRLQAAASSRALQEVQQVNGEHSAARWQTRDEASDLIGFFAEAAGLNKWIAQLNPWRTTPSIRLKLTDAAAMTQPESPLSACEAQRRLRLESPRNHVASAAISDGWLDLRALRAESMCLTRPTPSGPRWLPLDPSVLQRHGADYIGMMEDPKDSRAAVWGRCKAGKWTRLADGESVSDWKIAPCPGHPASGDSVVHARWCSDAACTAASVVGQRFFSPTIGERFALIAGSILLRPLANKYAVTRWRPPSSPAFGPLVPAAQAAVVYPTAGSARQLGDIVLPADKPRWLLLRDSRSDRGILLRWQSGGDANAPRLRVAIAKDRFIPGQNTADRGATFASLRPTLWRSRPGAAISRAKGGAPAVLLPGVGRFSWNQGWRSDSAELRQVGLSTRATTRTFRGERRTVQLSWVRARGWLAWMVFCGVGVVLGSLLACVRLGLAGRALRPIEAWTGLAFLATIGGFVATGVIQQLAAAISPAAFGSTLYLSAHVSWLCIGAACAWLLTSVVFTQTHPPFAVGAWSAWWAHLRAPIHWLPVAAISALPVLADRIVSPQLLSSFAEPDEVVFGGRSRILLLAVAAVVCTQLVRRLKESRVSHVSTHRLPETVIAALSALALGTHVLVSRPGLDRYLQIADDGWAQAALTVLGVALLAIVAPWLVKIVARFIRRVYVKLSSMAWLRALLMNISAPGRLFFGWVRGQPWARRGAGFVRGALTGADPEHPGHWLIGVFIAAAAMIVLAKIGGTGLGATLPDAVALYACVYAVQRGFARPTRPHRQVRAILRISGGLGFALLFSWFGNHDLGTTLVRATSVFLCAAWAVSRITSIRYAWTLALSQALVVFSAWIGELIPLICAALLCVMVTLYLTAQLQPEMGQKESKARRWTWSVLAFAPSSLATALLTFLMMPKLVRFFPTNLFDALSRAVVRAEEREQCAQTPEAWGYCEQLLDARRLLHTNIADWPSSVYVSNMHSDLGWAHAVHLGNGMALTLVLVAFTAALLAVLVVNGRRKAGWGTHTLAMVLGALALPTGYVALHVFGTLGVVPMSGVPWPLVSFANTQNALTIVVLGWLAASVGLVRVDAEIHTGAQRRALVALVLVATVSVSTGLLAWRSAAASPGLAHRPELPILIGVARPDRGGVRADVSLPAAPNKSPCGDLLTVKRLNGHPATAGATVVVGERLIRLVRATDGSVATAVVVGYLLPDKLINASRSMCSDASCDWMFEGRGSAALDRLSISRVVTGNRRDVLSLVRVGQIGCTDRTATSRCSIVRRTLGTEPRSQRSQDGPVEFVGVLPEASVAARSTVERRADVPRFAVRTTAGEVSIVPVRPTGLAEPGIALCIVGAPWLTAIEAAPPLAGDKGPAFVAGVWTRGGSGASAVVVNSERCSQVDCKVHVGWPTTAGDRSIRGPRMMADVAKVGWELAAASTLEAVGPLGGNVWRRRELTPGQEEAGYSERALAAFRPDHNDGRRLLAHAMRRWLGAIARHATDEVAADVLLATNLSSVRRDPALRFELTPSTTDAWHAPAASVLSLRWFDTGRSFRTGLQMFLAPSSFGVGSAVPQRELTLPQRGGAAVSPATFAITSKTTLSLSTASDGAGVVTLLPPQLGTSAPSVTVRRPSDREPKKLVATAVGLSVAGKASIRDDAEITDSAGGRDHSGFTGWYARVRSGGPDANATRSRAARLHNQITSAAILDVTRPVLASAAKDGVRSTLVPDVQTVLEHEALAWLEDAHQSASARAIGALTAQASTIGGAMPRMFAHRAANRRRKVGVMLIDYEAGTVLGWAEAHGGAGLHDYPGQRRAPPLMLDASIEVASVWKPISAALLPTQSGAAPWWTKGHFCDGRRHRPGGSGGAASLALAPCSWPMGQMTLQTALAESCNHYLARAFASLSGANRSLYINNLESLGFFHRHAIEQSVAGLFLPREQVRQVRRELAEHWPLSLSATLHQGQLIDSYLAEVAWRRAAAGAGDLMARDAWRGAYWVNGMRMAAAPIHVASLHAALARAALPAPSGGVATGKSKPACSRDEVQWLSPRTRDTTCGTAAKRAGHVLLKRWMAQSGLRNAVLDGMAGTVANGTAASTKMSAIAQQLRLVGKTGTSTNRHARRHWQHLVSYVDPRAPWAKSRPWLLWVSVELEPLAADGGDFPAELSAAGAATRFWRVLAGGAQ